MAKTVKARVLLDCELGRVNDVVELEQKAADARAKSGEIDIHPDAVAYAETLPQNAERRSVARESA